MAKPKLSPREIVQRLQMIDALMADGMPVAEADPLGRSAAGRL